MTKTEIKIKTKQNGTNAEKEKKFKNDRTEILIKNGQRESQNRTPSKRQALVK